MVRHTRTRLALPLLAAIALAAVALGTPSSSSAMTAGQSQSSAPSWMAMVRYANGSLKCGGAVVGDGWVLTAAHCTYNKNGAKLAPKDLKVSVGVTSPTDTRGATYSIANIYRDPSNIADTAPVHDVALLQLNGFDSTRWDALPIATDPTAISTSGGVTLYSYGNTGFDKKGNETGAGQLMKSPDGSLTYDSSCSYSGVCCFGKTSSTQIMNGDSGSGWLRWKYGAWQIISVVSLVNLASPGSTNHISAQGPSPLAQLSDGRSIATWIRQTVGAPIPPANTIVRDSASGTAYMYEADGYRHWIPTGGDYNCFVGQGDRVVNMTKINLHTMPEWVGSQATCTVTPPPPTTYAEQEGSHGANSFLNYHNASGVGAFVSAGQRVNVSCKVYDPTIVTVNPDGYWYRLADSPWSNQYYAAANTFMNGDPWGGPYTHNTDFNVPDC